MKLSYPLTLFASYVVSTVVGHEGECTIGTLFVSSWNSTKIHGMHLDGASYSNLTVTYEIDTSMKEQWLDDSEGGSVFASIYRGNVTQRYTDGKVKFISTRTTIEDHGDHIHLNKGTPKELVRDTISCARPIHFEKHDGKIGIFCDGFYPIPYNPSLQVNTTIWIVDESKFGKGAVTWTRTEQGTHHGVVIPVDDGHTLRSVPSVARVNGNSTNSLPDGFEILDAAGNAVHKLNDNATKWTHCSGYHGSGVYKNTMVFACDNKHGGFLVVDYREKSETYTSRSYMYPAGLPHRSGTVVNHKKHSIMVANFAATNQTSHLFMFDAKKGRRSVRQQNILTLDFITGSQCSFQFEKGFGTKMLVWLPNGKLRVYSTNPLWGLIKEVDVIPGMTVCTGTSFVAGYNTAFVMTLNPPAVLTIDLNNFSVQTTSLPFSPFSAVVSGVPTGSECKECVMEEKACNEHSDCCDGMTCYRSSPGPKRCHSKPKP